MNQQVNAMQESIKIALDAADAATDVTSVAASAASKAIFMLSCIALTC